MDRRIPKTPEGYRLIGDIYWHDDSRVMSEDMAEVSIGDVLVCCGWYERNNKPGLYRITAIRELDELERRVTGDLDEAVRFFEILADKYAACARVG